MADDLENYLVREIPDDRLRFELMKKPTVQGFNMRRPPFLTGILVDRIAEWEQTQEAIIERINHCIIHELTHRFLGQEGMWFWWEEVDIEAIAFFMEECIYPGSVLKTWKKMHEFNKGNSYFEEWTYLLLTRLRNFPFINIEEV